MPKFESRPAQQAPSRITILRRGYIALGIILEVALILASYALRLENLHYSELFFLGTGVFTALWGMCWGVWERSMFHLWAIMAGTATLALLGGGILDFQNVSQLAALLGAAGGEFVLWVIFSAIAIASCSER